MKPVSPRRNPRYTLARHASVAQLEEQRISTPSVGGSTPSGRATLQKQFGRSIQNGVRVEPVFAV